MNHPLLHVGDCYRETTPAGVRVLRVDAIGDPIPLCDDSCREIFCTVIRHECGGTVTEPMTATHVRARQLLSGAYTAEEI
ncbi:hypothetical protein [Nocardia farcinica]|uniref:hypothetical protein n=1 Tax=Nocardia farcinica TaxID=37329 RepID=UPI002457E4F1|nr:hypothetical protein [Nocardia farcinica]